MIIAAYGNECSKQVGSPRLHAGVVGPGRRLQRLLGAENCARGAFRRRLRADAHAGAAGSGRDGASARRQPNCRFTRGGSHREPGKPVQPAGRGGSAFATRRCADCCRWQAAPALPGWRGGRRRPDAAVGARTARRPCTDCSIRASSTAAPTRKGRGGLPSTAISAAPRCERAATTPSRLNRLARLTVAAAPGEAAVGLAPSRRAIAAGSGGAGMRVGA